jgi:hypothetical protein
MIRSLPLLAACALGAAAPAAAQAAAPLYGVGISGTQTTTWSYQGTNPGSCDTPVDGAGKHVMKFRTDRLDKVLISKVGGVPVFDASPDPVATFERTGRFVVHDSKTYPCSDAQDDVMDASGCRRGTYKLDQTDIQAGLMRPTNQVKVQSTTSDYTKLNPCPWFQGPDSQNYFPQPKATEFPSHDAENQGGGLLFTQRKLSKKVTKLKRGKSLRIAMGRSRVYRFENEFGQLKGRTTMQMTLVIRRCKNSSTKSRKC